MPGMTLPTYSRGRTDHLGLARAGLASAGNTASRMMKKRPEPKKSVGGAMQSAASMGMAGAKVGAMAGEGATMSSLFGSGAPAAPAVPAAAELAGPGLGAAMYGASAAPAAASVAGPGLGAASYGTTVAAETAATAGMAGVGGMSAMMGLGIAGLGIGLLSYIL